MRGIFIALWLLLPIGLVAFHHGPGKDLEKLDLAAVQLKLADKLIAEEDFHGAVDAYDVALGNLDPEDINSQRKIRLARAQTRMLASELPVANEELAGLIQEMDDDPEADSKVAQEARASYANSQYYMTWLMRLEGLPREVWEPEVDVARQHYRLLSESARDSGDVASQKRFSEDLESSIRLARMDLTELQGLPLPSQ